MGPSGSLCRRNGNPVYQHVDHERRPVGKAGMGIWWTWDARLTLQFLLGLVFLSYLMLRAYLPEREKKAALGGVFGVLAMVDVPFNYLSIRWWRTQHPQPVILGGGLDTDMWKVMLVSFLAFAALYAYLLDRRIAIARVEEEVEYLEDAILAHD